MPAEIGTIALQYSKCSITHYTDTVRAVKCTYSIHYTLCIATTKVICTINTILVCITITIIISIILLTRTTARKYSPRTL